MARTRYKIFKDDITPYFVTATTVNWLPLFSNLDIAQIIFNSLRFLQEQNRLSIIAYVLMENHLHMVAFSEHLSKEIGDFKSYTARQCIDYYQEQGNEFILDQLAFFKIPHRIDRDYQFWQEGSHPKQIQSLSMLQQKVDYIHFNPVKRGYVDAPTDWRYSSARNYAGLQAMIEICKDW